MRDIVKKATRPHIANAIVALYHALMFGLWQFGFITPEMAAVLEAVLSAAGLLLAAWYSPNTSFGAENEFPKWLEEEPA